MRHTTKATVRIFSLLLAVTLTLTAFPVSAFASIDEPLTGVIGNGWEDFGGDLADFEPSPLTDSNLDDDYIDGIANVEEFDTVNDSISTGTEMGIAPNVATPATTLGAGEDNPMAWFEEYRAWATEQMENGRTRGAGSPVFTLYKWGNSQESDRVYFANGGYINSSLPRVTIAGKAAFCIVWNGQNPVGNYTSSPYNPDPRIAQIIANYEASGKSGHDYAAAQIAIWEIVQGTSVSSWGTCSTSSSINAIKNGSADYSGYQFERWSGGAQDLIAWDNEPPLDSYQLKIIKKNEDGSKVVSNATFNVTGPGGFNYTGKTNTKGEIIVLGITTPGVCTVKETIPPAGYKPAVPDTKTVTLSEEDKIAVVEFFNVLDPTTPPGDLEGDNYHIQVETTVDTETEVYNQKSYSYSDAIGQITIRKHDQDGKSLDGALFNIDVAFSDGSHTTVNNWEVDNGARLFTWTHPQDNHDPATVTVTEAQPPRYYIGDPTPKTAVVHPTYTRVTHVETWTVTVTTENTSCTVIEIDSGDAVANSNSSSSASVTSDPQVEEFSDFVEGDRETTVTFVNQRITGDIVVTKRDANTGQALAGATIHLWGTDLGEPSTIDRTIVTGANGTAVFDNLPPGTYAFKETQPPYGYNINNDLQTAVLQSGQVLQKEIRNYRKDGLFIKKTDQNGAPLPGAVFELRRGSGEVLLSEVTNENGLIYRGYLAEGLYVMEEISAPEGYLLDENPIKELYIYSTDSNKEYTVSFVNKKKPSIEVTKVDGDTPTVKLEGAVFRITDTRTNQYWDIQTGADGTALLENLDLNTTYIVEETEAPQGYVNSGYKQEIVLKECRKHTITVSNFHMPKLTIIKKDVGSGALLSGATFRVSWNSGADYRDVTTDANGEAVMTDLTPGWYTVTETKAPTGYLLNSTPQQVLIVDGQDKVIELFNEAKPSLKVIKVDNVTKTPLQYAEFSIYKKNGSTEQYIGKYISDVNGEIHLENIDPGRYVIRETKAPDGFEIDTELHEITIASGQKYELEVSNTPQSPIYIQKVDDKGNPLMGAKFKVTTMNGAMVGTATTGRTGYAIIPYAEAGWYVVEETTAPDGYILSSTPMNVEVKSGRPAQVEFVNHKKPQLSILKLDKSDNKALMGARIKVTKSNGQSLSGGEIIGTFTTDANGLVTLTDLEAGSYTVTEIAAPDGYILDDTPQIVELKAGESKQIELYNDAKPGLQLRKIDKLTNMPVANAVFSLVRLESGAKRDLGTYTTGTNGLFYVPDLAPGNYVITEFKAPNGYILDPTPQNIYIEGGKLNTVEVFNMPYSNLRLLKIDAETREPLGSAVFKLYDEKRLEIGTYTTSTLGEIVIPSLPSGVYFLQEQKAPTGYVLDNTVRQIELIGGKTTTVEWKNTALGSLRVIKLDKITKKPLYGATFLLYDGKDNLLGEFTTDQNGTITFGRNLQAGKYKLKEVKAPDGYVLDDTVKSITVKDGGTTEIVIENEPKRGRIQIQKVSSAYNDLTKDKEGATLKGVKFEVYNNKMELVDIIESDRNGICTSKHLPLGVYGVKEVSGTDYFITDSGMFYAELKIHDDLVKFKFVNKPVHVETSIQKRGVVEAMAGSSVYYDFTGIENKSNVPLEDFYWRDVLPTEAVRLEKIWTGVWNERVSMELQIKTNLKSGYRTVKKGLISTVNNEINCSRSALGLAVNEYVTEFRLVFGKVQAGFHETTGAKIQVKVLDTVTNGQKFTNKTDVGGRYIKEWVYDTDGWTSVAYNRPKGNLPRTGR